MNFEDFLREANTKPDYTTNAGSYYKELARKNHLIELLSKRIWEYDEELAKRFAEWDKNLEEFPDEIEKLLRDWIDDGTFAHIINEEIFQTKADTIEMRNEFKIRAVNTLWYGIDGTSESDNVAFNTLLSESNGRTIILGSDMTIDVKNPIKLGSNVSIDLNGFTIKTLNDSNGWQEHVFTLTAGSKNINIFNGYFDLEDKAGNIFLIEDGVQHYLIEDLIIKNVYDRQSATELNCILIRLNTEGIINNIHFENIKKVGNGIIADGPGRAACIKTSQYSTETKFVKTVISNIWFKNCYNVNTDGSFLVEDFDCIYLAHGNKTNPSEKSLGFVVIENIYAENVSKRIIKAQASGCIIKNVYGWFTEIPCQYAISVFFGNNHVENVNLTGDFGYSLNIESCSNSTFKNFNLDCTKVGTNGDYGSIYIVNSYDISLSHFYGKVNAGITLFGFESHHITFTDFSLKTDMIGILIKDRTFDNAGANNVRINNIVFNNVSMVQTKPSNVSYVRVWNTNTGGQMNTIIFNQCDFTVTQEYQYGAINTISVNKLMFNLLTIRKTGNTTVTELVTLKNATLVLDNTSLNSSDVSVMMDNSHIDSFRSTLTALTLKNNSSADLGRSDIGTISNTNTDQTNVIEW